jgi:hypothetical protein
MVFSYTIQQVPVELQMMSDSARVWIFQSETELSNKDVFVATEQIRGFLEQWTAHNRQLDAHGAVFYNRFIVIVLDEEQSHNASGCSIDSLTRYIQNVGDQLDTNVMDRQNFFFLKNNQVVGVNMTDVPQHYKSGQVTEDSLVFNNLIKTKAELFSKWLVPIKDSWQWRFVN